MLQNVMGIGLQETNASKRQTTPSDIQKSTHRTESISAWFRSDPGGARTLDPLIKSQLLYQLSYGVIF